MDEKISVEFSGGAELLFGNKKTHTIGLDLIKPNTIEALIEYLKNKLLQEREELFVKGNTVRPGILVLINEADWELLGELKYELKDKDTILFISTLHGG